ncbi:Parp12 [Symbiodinium natans]|uniref:Poly [ADP-ribose] polymerase n=1 Tax=Symbiodinium natans TaxID=878477 RepID=A0A812NWB5_9DINO|nr:Parp12 [Symbiodinium natans]
MEFKVKGSKPGRQFSAEISLLGGAGGGDASVVAAFAKQEHLPTDWKHYSVYAASVVFEYHNDQGPEFNIHLDPTVGVRLLGEDVLPNAVLLGSHWAPDNDRWKWLREHGNLHWQGKYAMSTPAPLEKGSQRRLLEFRVKGSSPGRRFSAYLEFQDPMGRRMGELTLLSRIALPREMTTYSFDVEQVALTYHNDQGPEFNIHLDPTMGVRLLGEDVLPSAVLLGSGWAPDNPRWQTLREHGNLHWQGKYEMRPGSGELQRGGIKIMEFKVKGSKPGRQFSAEISLLGGGVSVAARFAKQEHLPTDWEHYSVYAASVVFEYHNDQGPEFNIHLDPTVGVRLLGEDVLPNAVLLGSDWAPDNDRWKWLREHGNLHWQGKYAMSTPVPLEKGSQRRLLEFRVRGSSPGRLFSAYLELQDPMGRRMGELTLLSRIALPLEMTTYSFDVEQVALTYHNDQGPEFNIHLDPTVGVRLLGEDVLPSAVLLGSGWAPDNPRWKWLREHGNLHWRGKYEMRPASSEDDILNRTVEMPAYWHLNDESMESKRVPETPEVCQAMQSLMDSTWKAIATRDRAEEEEEELGGGGGGVQRFEVVQVLRNENPSLWVPYWRQRERIRRQCGDKSLPAETVKTSLCEEFCKTSGHASLCHDAREFYLFHGTNPSAANAICASDFRVDLAGSHKGTLYGKGIYFAEASSKSDEYASDDQDGLHCMLLCKVSCGDWIYTDEVKPDVEALLQKIQSGQHHSILGDREKARGTYREFILFNNDQVYPEYIVVYKRHAVR